jgi:hypothetical protein
MRIASGIDFLLGKDKFQMYDELPKFSGRIGVILTLRVLNRSLRETLKTAFFTINAISENQANRYMLQEEDLGLGNQDSCPWRECQTKKNYEVFEAIPNELGSSDFSRRQV